MTLIIGIDPGSRMTGYGIISTDNDKLSFLDAGTIRTSSTDITERIAQIFAGVSRIVTHYQKYSGVYQCHLQSPPYPPCRER